MNQPATSIFATSKTPRRGASGKQISESDLVLFVRTAIARAEESDQPLQRPMITDSGFERQSREYERRSDRFSCFLACLTGALGTVAPEVAAEIYAFIGLVHRGEAPGAVATASV